MKHFALMFCLSFFVMSFQASAEDWEPIPETEDFVLGPVSLLTIDKPVIHHGFASDGVRYYFAAEMTALPSIQEELSVNVYLIETGELVAELPPPERGWNKPFTVKAIADSVMRQGRHGVTGSLIVLDSLVPTKVGEPAILVEYDYSYSRDLGFLAAKVAEHPLPMDNPNTPDLLEGMIYPAGFAINTSNGRFVIADCVLGGLWSSEDGMNTWTLRLLAPFNGPFGLTLWPHDVTIDHDDDPTTPEVLGIWAWDESDTPVPFGMPQVPGLGMTVIPGLHGVEYIPITDSFAYNSPAPTSKIAIITDQALGDDTVSPYAKQSEELVPAIPGVTDWAGTLQYNEWKKGEPSEYVYFLRSLGETSWPGMHPNGDLPPTWYRVNIHTHELEMVVSDSSLRVPSHAYPVPCQSAILDHFGTCLVAINSYQKASPEFNSFLNPPYTSEPYWGNFPQENEFHAFFVTEIM